MSFPTNFSPSREFSPLADAGRQQREELEMKLKDHEMCWEAVEVSPLSSELVGQGN